MKEVWGCNKRTLMSEPTLEYTDGDNHVRLWDCPNNYIPKSVYQFLKIINYTQKYNAPVPQYGDVSVRFLKASAWFDHIYNEALATKRKEGN